ncbi:hypothetical protein LCGC14_0401890 [marine sediment metagenome]|uniref:Type II secretion system protein GspG C-terminal domain-containing protein n=1 Tax=marine sediment metagenome TaxID=412755 RepID=A0A0F9W5K8_9ZZZZ|nr:hypothetical protein [Phycisphaerae bacterium]HDZ42876.1 hypothetical protein [Phycisphaerae bacterium]
MGDNTNAGPPQPLQQPRRWLTGKRLLWMGLLIVLVLLAAAAYWPVDYSLKVSPETTYLTGPLREDGTVDYVEALRRLGVDHIATDENAVRLFAQAFGPSLWLPETLDDALAELGLPPLPAGGDYFVRFQKFVKTLPADQQEFVAAADVLAAAIKTPWSADQYPRIAQWLADIDEPLALIVQGAERPHFCLPVVPHEATTLLDVLLSPHLASLRDADRALTARAMLRAGRGDLDGARSDLLACHRMGRLVGRHWTVLSYMAGIGIERRAYDAHLALVKTGRLSREQTAVMLADLQARPPVRSFADHLEQGERLLILDQIQQMLRGETSELGDLNIIGHRNVNLNIALRMANECWGGMIAAMGKADYGEYCLAYDQWGRDAEKWFTGEEVPDRDESIDYALYRAKFIALSLSGNLGRPTLSRIVGTKAIQYSIPSMSHIRALEERFRTWDELTKLALALSLHKHDHGQYPDDLAALAGDYLPAVFKDRFTGDPLHYQRQGQGYLLYSVGWDQIDDGGLNADGEPAEDDLAIQIK